MTSVSLSHNDVCSLAFCIYFAFDMLSSVDDKKTALTLTPALFASLLWES